jgi:uracil-DNA glycosylase family 4
MRVSGLQAGQLDFRQRLWDVVKSDLQLDPVHVSKESAVLPMGPQAAPICFVGRDPGAEEVEKGLPFVGEAGRQLRDCLRQVYAPMISSSLDESLGVGANFFWMNTVPFKPNGNKTWSAKVRRDCHPVLLQMLQEGWAGSNVVTLGKEAFFWFSLAQTPEEVKRLRKFWHQGDSKYTSTIDVRLPGTQKRVTLYPVPHPCRRNARWAKRFPDLFIRRLKNLQS